MEDNITLPEPTRLRLLAAYEDYRVREENYKLQLTIAVEAITGRADGKIMLANLDTGTVTLEVPEEKE